MHYRPHRHLRTARPRPEAGWPRGRGHGADCTEARPLRTGLDGPDGGPGRRVKGGCARYDPPDSRAAAGRVREERCEDRPVCRAGGRPAGAGPRMGGGAAGGIRGHAAHILGPARPGRRVGQRHDHAAGASGIVRRSGIPEGRRGRGAAAAVVHGPARTAHPAGACAVGRGRPGGPGAGAEPADVARHGADRQDPAVHAGRAGAPGRRPQPVHHRAGRLARGPGLQRALPALRQRRAADDGVRGRERPPHLPDAGPVAFLHEEATSCASSASTRGRASTPASGSGAATRGAAGRATPWSSRRRTSTASTGSGGSGPGLHLIERLTRVDDETILYEFTVDDPETWTEPWSVEMPCWCRRGSSTSTRATKATTAW